MRVSQPAGVRSLISCAEVTYAHLSSLRSGYHLARFGRRLRGGARRLGGASIAFASYALLGHHDNVVARRKTEQRTAAFEASLVPLLALNGAPGLELSVRF